MIPMIPMIPMTLKKKQVYNITGAFGGITQTERWLIVFSGFMMNIKKTGIGIVRTKHKKN